MEIAAARNEDALFAALTDPVRRSILSRLRTSDATVTELANDLGVGLPSMSKHLNVLETAGFVARHAEAQRRRCSLNAEAFVRLRAWTQHYEAVWSDRLDRLDAVLDIETDR